MASLTIRNLDEGDKHELQKIAAANGRSMEEELRVTIRRKVLSERAGRRKKHLVDLIHAAVDKYGPLDIELPAREAGREPPDFSK